MNPKKQDHPRVIKVLKAIAHPDRLRIVEALAGRRRSVGELTHLLKTEQAVVSKNLAVLKREGVVECEADGTYRYYSLGCAGVLDVIKCVRDRKRVKK